MIKFTIVEFYECWFDTDRDEHFIEIYFSKKEIWQLYKNQLALEIYDFELDEKYMDNIL